MNNIEQKIKEVAAEQLGVDIETITGESSFTDDLGADSLDVVELIMALEEEFDTEIPDDEAETLKTVGDVVGFIEKQQAA